MIKSQDRGWGGREQLTSIGQALPLTFRASWEHNAELSLGTGMRVFQYDGN